MTAEQTENTLLEEVLARLEHMAGGGSVYLYVEQLNEKDNLGDVVPYYGIAASPSKRDSEEGLPDGAVLLFGDRHSTGGSCGDHAKEAAILCIATILTVFGGLDVYVKDVLFDPRQV